jgi:hypothetical protein
MGIWKRNNVSTRTSGEGAEVKGVWEDFKHRGTKRSNELHCLKCTSKSFGIIVGIKKGQKEFSFTVTCVECGWEKPVKRTDKYEFKCAACPEVHTLQEVIAQAEKEINRIPKLNKEQK